MVNIEHLGLDVSICCNGTPLPEYDDPEPELHSDGAQVRYRYVESKDDAEFTIRVEAKKSPLNAWVWFTKDTGLSARCRVDGRPVSDRLFKQSKLPIVDVVEGKRYQNSDNLTLLQRFRFANVVTVDESDKSRLQVDSATAKDLGVIRVEVLRVTVIGRMDRPGAGRTVHASFELAEKALKGRALSHGTAYSSPQVTQASHFYNAPRLDPAPIAVFNFKYRSRAALQREMIIPRSPSLSPVAEAIANLSPGEVNRRLRESFLRLKREDEPERKPSVKRELAAAYDLTGDDVVEMPPPKMARRSVKEEVLDLTED